jgi:hypothetical protein
MSTINDADAVATIDDQMKPSKVLAPMAQLRRGSGAGQAEE